MYRINECKPRAEDMQSRVSTREVENQSPTIVIFSLEWHFSFSFSLLINISRGVVIVRETVHRIVRVSLAMANTSILNSSLKSLNGTGDASDRGEPSNVARFYICNDFIGSGRTPKDPLLSTRISYWHRAAAYLRPRALRNAAYCIVFVSRIATRVIGPEHTAQDASSEPGGSYTVIALISMYIWWRMPSDMGIMIHVSLRER